MRQTEDKIKKLFLGSSAKSCDPNSIPTRVLKNCLDIQITPINDIIVSMDKGEVTTLTLFDLSAAFDNKPEYFTDLLVGPKC